MSDQTTTSDQVLSDQVKHVLRHAWAPIGLGAELQPDEYDDYVPGLVALAQGRTAFASEIAAHLLQIEAEMMMLSPQHARATREARALLGLREANSRSYGVLVTQVVSSDGLRCLWLFQRSDRFYTYEHAVLQHENDKNGAWSWWADAGQGQSGLFASAEAAERDARAAIEWTR